MIKIINCTPHAINLNSGAVFAPSGIVARVSVQLTKVEVINPTDCDCDECRNGGGCGHWLSHEIPVFKQVFGQVIDLPASMPDTFYIVSGLVLDAVKASGRKDCLAPATGHTDTRRNDKGHIISVPGFIS